MINLLTYFNTTHNQNQILMVFSSLVFLFIFLPFIILTYLIVGIKIRNVLLLIASLLFYAWGEGELVLLMIVSIIINYIAGLLIDKTRDQNVYVKSILFIGVSINLLFLVYYKYSNFIFDNLQQIGLFQQFENKDITLPIGISFFTFQSISYLVDVYRKESPAQKNPLHLGLYISLFPQLIAGPIVRYADIADQIKNRVHNSSLFSKGVIRFIRGLAKKVIIANNMALIADVTFGIGANELPVLIAWLGIICYALQIYFDFSGYSDMAIGLGLMFGFEFKENFNYPYISQSIQEFWRRWHISLSSWFRDYLYIPLGGSRKGVFNTYRNLVIVFLVTGLWHGASWNFIIWGVFHGMFLIFERIGLKNQLKKLPSFIAHFYLLIVVLIGWVFFKAETLDYALNYIGTMFGINAGSDYLPLLYFNNFTIIIFFLGICFSMPLRNKISHFIEKAIPQTQMANNLKYVCYLVLFGVTILELAGSSYNPFIYFRF